MVFCSNMNFTLADNFLKTTLHLYQGMSESQKTNCNEICAIPVLSTPSEIFTKHQEKFIDLLLTENFVPRRCVIIGYKSNIVVLIQDSAIEESVIDLTLKCRFCLQRFINIHDWIEHIDELSCFVTNPYRWFPSLIALTTTNRMNEVREITSRRKVTILELNNERIFLTDSYDQQDPDTDEEREFLSEIPSIQ